MACQATRIEKIPTKKEIAAYMDAVVAEPGCQARMYAPQHQPHQGWRLGRV